MINSTYALNNEQIAGYNILCSGSNVFLTGGAGVGKSFLINKYISDMRAKHKNVLVCAPTGVAAGNVNGITLHRAFEMPLGVILQKDIRNIEKYNKEIDELLFETDILIIDEIQESSMVYNSIRALQGELNCHVAVTGSYV